MSLDPLPVLLTIEQTREQLQVSRATVYRLIAEGTLRAVKIRSRYRIPRAAIEELAQSDGHATEDSSQG